MAKDKICTPFLALASPENKFTVNTIEDMKGRKYLKIGDVVDLNGYYTAGDGAGHKRKIEAIDDGSGVQLANGLWANIVHNGEVNVSWFGAKGDGVTDDTVAIQRTLDFCSKFKLNCISGKFNYLLSQTLNSPLEFNLDFGNSTFIFDLKKINVTHGKYKVCLNQTGANFNVSRCIKNLIITSKDDPPSSYYNGSEPVIGIRLHKINASKFENITIQLNQSTDSTGILLDDGCYILLFDSCVLNRKFKIEGQANTGENIKIQNSVFHNSPFEKEGMITSINPASELYVDNCSFDYVNVAVRNTGMTIVMDSCHFERPFYTNWRPDVTTPHFEDSMIISSGANSRTIISKSFIFGKKIVDSSVQKPIKSLVLIEDSKPATDNPYQSITFDLCRFIFIEAEKMVLDANGYCSIRFNSSQTNRVDTPLKGFGKSMNLATSGNFSISTNSDVIDDSTEDNISLKITPRTSREPILIKVPISINNSHNSLSLEFSDSGLAGLGNVYATIWCERSLCTSKTSVFSGVKITKNLKELNNIVVANELKYGANNNFLCINILPEFYSNSEYTIKITEIASF
ncbi:MAG: glycosyl hydrolase family 28-related protein [Cetobacterium sp.]|uniref:glycosyl hydrolase family 28-related protein n=1 Tax=Cetobacterium sp. TaxID=2071632 RepID=UPI003F33F16D